MNRLRTFVIGWLASAGVSLWLAGCTTATAAPGDAAARTSARSDSVARAVEVAPGVYMVQGEPGEVEPGNGGRIGNAGFIVGAKGVVAIDTGTSYRHGEALLAALRRVTDKPVLLAIVTHTRQEFLFGAGAYREQGIPIHMQRMAAGLMQARCERCLKTLNTVLGAEAMQRTAMFKADREFDATHTIDAIGRRIEVLYHGHSSGPGDVAVLDTQTGTLFAGGLLDAQRVPDVQDADLDGWAKALGALRALPISTIVPGHGPAGSVRLIDDVDRYLAQLRVRIDKLLASGAALSDVADAAALPGYARWDQYDTIHRRNASVLYVRLERDQMFKRAGAPSVN